MDLYKKDLCGKVITAACCLHNICISNHDQFDAAEIVQPQICIQEIREETISGATKRNDICEALADD